MAGLSEAEKKPGSPVGKAALAADAEILAREAPLRKNPNIELTSLDHSAQMGLAERAAGEAPKSLRTA